MTSTKNYLVILRQCEELLISEGIQAAMIFASYGESVQLVYNSDCSGLINQPNTHIAKLVSSLEFYDIEPPTELVSEIYLTLSDYQQVLSF